MKNTSAESSEQRSVAWPTFYPFKQNFVSMRLIRCLLLWCGSKRQYPSESESPCNKCCVCFFFYFCLWNDYRHKFIENIVCKDLNTFSTFQYKEVVRSVLIKHKLKLTAHSSTMFDQKQHYRSRRKTHNAYASILKQKFKPYNDLLICRSLKQQSHLARKQRETAVHNLCYLTKKCYFLRRFLTDTITRKDLPSKPSIMGSFIPLSLLKFVLKSDIVSPRKDGHPSPEGSAILASITEESVSTNQSIRRSDDLVRCCVIVCFLPSFFPSPLSAWARKETHASAARGNRQSARKQVGVRVS